MSRARDLLRLAAEALEDGRDPLSQAFLVEHQVTLDECYNLADAMAAAIRFAARPAAPAGLDDLLHRVDEAIGGAPGMYVAGYGGSMIGRDHAVRVVSDALRAAYAEGASR
jgi:hypothetical protein